MIPKGNVWSLGRNNQQGTIVAREQAFYTLLTDNIDMVNTWYIAKLNEYRDKIAKYEKQVEHFCELRRISSMSQSQTYRQLEFGLKVGMIEEGEKRNCIEWQAIWRTTACWISKPLTRSWKSMIRTVTSIVEELSTMQWIILASLSNVIYLVSNIALRICGEW